MASTIDDLDPLQFMIGLAGLGAVVGLIGLVLGLGDRTGDAPATVRVVNQGVTASGKPVECLGGERGGEPVRIRDADGRGRFITKACVGGRLVRFLVDTGATSVALTWRDAESIGLDPKQLKFSGRASTAGGVTRIAPVTIPEIDIGGIVVRNVRAVVAQPRDLSESLLGMSFLTKTSFEYRSGELILKP